MQSQLSREGSEAILGLEVSVLMITHQGQDKRSSSGLLSTESNCDRQLTASDSSKARVEALPGISRTADSPKGKKAHPATS